jgi:hypothetical protein
VGAPVEVEVRDAGAGSDPPVDFQSGRRARGVSMAGLITLLFGASGFALSSGSLSDNSFLWHLRTGGLILDTGIPHADPYSFTAAGTHWIAQSWLAELMYAVLERSIGDHAIRLAVGIAGACIAVFLFRVAFHTADDRVRGLAIAVPALACSFTVQSERPLWFGLALLGAVVFTVEVPDSLLGRHPRVVIPVAMWLWVNTHGTFALGFAYLVFYLVGRRLDGASFGRGRERDLLIAVGIAAVAIFVNPYGPSLVLFPVALMGRSKVLSNVAEWQSVSLHSLGGLFYAFWLFLSVVALARSKPRRGDVLVSVVFLALGWWAVRNVAIAVAVTVPVVGRAFRPVRDPDAAPVDHEARYGTATPLLAVLVCLVSLLLVAQAARQPDFDLRRYPVSALHALDTEHRLGGRLLTTDAWAGYVIYKYWPEQHVFFDDRYDMYPIALTAAYNKVLGLKPGWEQVLDQYRINIVVWPRAGAIVQALDHLPGWKRVRTDKVAATFIRTHPY